MPLYRPSELRAFLDELGVRPKKSLSQNFLVDGNTLKKIADLALPKKGEVIIEIGPGPGVLTEHLVEKGFAVIAIEKDAIFAKTLHRLNSNDLLQVIEADALEVSFDVLSSKGASVIANIPYSITTPLIEKIVTCTSLTSATLLIQEEVAKKITAGPGCDGYGYFSIFVQYFSLPTYGFFVPKTCFYPKPKVGSSVIRLDLKKRFACHNEVHFFMALKMAFSERRKMLKSTLKELYDQDSIERSFKEFGISIDARPDELSTESWVSLINMLEGNGWKT